MSLTKGKHIVKELDNVLCTVVETGVSADRMEFLKELLELNHFEVKILQEDTPDSVDESVTSPTQPTFTIGVTDLVFNPVIAVYEKSLKRQDGKAITPSYWNQEPEIDLLPYFEYREKNAKAKNDDDFIANPWAYRTI